MALLRASFLDFLLALPHLLILLWVVWLILTPAQAGYLLDKKNKPSELARSGELLSFREVLAIGCVGGFILLTFITAFCSWVTLRIAGVL